MVRNISAELHSPLWRCLFVKKFMSVIFSDFVAFIVFANMSIYVKTDYHRSSVRLCFNFYNLQKAEHFLSQHPYF